MGLFDKIKKNTPNKAAAEKNKQSVNAEAQQEEKKAEQFSKRMGGIFGRMYRLILSVDLQSDVYQIESGELRIGTDELKLRDHYEAWLELIAEHVIAEDVERFKSQFSRQNLSKELLENYGSVSSIYCVSDDPTEDSALEYHFYEFRADRLPDTAESEAQRVRCIIYVKPVKEPKKAIVADPNSVPEGSMQRDWNEIRITKLLGGNLKTAPIFFEYEIASDTLTMHVNTKDGGFARSVINNYIRNIEVRGDWTIFHGDLKTVVNVITDAIKGKHSTGLIKYRPSGVDKNVPFKIHRIVCAPAEPVVPPVWVIGALSDVDEMVKTKDNRRAINSYVQDLFAAEESTMAEIDVEKDLLFRLKRGEDGYERFGNGVSFVEYENKRMANGTIAKEDVALFKNIIKPGYLEKKTMNGNYSFEARIKPVGLDTYRWYAYTFARVGQTARFIMMIRDVTEMQAARAREYAVQERSRFMDYNEKMLDTMASLVEFRNVESGAHITHVKKLTRILLEDVANRSPNYKLTQHMIDVYVEASIMHDIGKIVVPDYILNKSGKLTTEEFDIMKRHTTDGARIIDRLDLKGQEELMEYCREVALHHHERFDGKGYPEGLVGDETPIGVQCVGLADVYDAIVSVRCYKQGMTHEQAVQMILNGECGAFNPRLMESFRVCTDRMHALYVSENDYEQYKIEQ